MIDSRWHHCPDDHREPAPEPGPASGDRRRDCRGCVNPVDVVDREGRPGYRERLVTLALTHLPMNNPTAGPGTSKSTDAAPVGVTFTGRRQWPGLRDRCQPVQCNALCCTSRQQP